MNTITLENMQTYQCEFAGKTSTTNLIFVISGAEFIDIANVFSNPAMTRIIKFDSSETHIEFAGYCKLVYISQEANGIRIALEEETV